NWGILNRETDYGFLKIDPARRCLTFEGILERYRIPADAITSCEVEPILPAENFYAVVLRCLCQGEGGVVEWELPFRVACTTWCKVRRLIRLEWTTELHERIETLRSTKLG